jgi:hypothetical protein
MASPNKRKANDTTIMNLNNVGISLCGIAERLGVHHTTVTHRLKVMGLAPADTRRAFMEDIYEGLSMQQQQWLINQLGPGYSVKEFVRSLLLKEFIGRTPAGTPALSEHY